MKTKQGKGKIKWAVAVIAYVILFIMTAVLIL